MCVYCGLFHAPDYSDVRGTIQEWVESVCRHGQVEAERARRRVIMPTDPPTAWDTRDFGTGSPVPLQRYDADGILERPPAGTILPWEDKRLVDELVSKPKVPELQVMAGPGVAEVAAFERQVREMAQPSVLHVKFMRNHGHAGNPTQAYRGDAGYDLELCEDYALESGVWQNLRTGIVAAIPSGYWGHILARSSTWRKLGIRVEPAVIDSSYRGELMVYAVNTKKELQDVKVGQRLAQIIIVPLLNVEWLEQGRLPPGEREERGYGSSGQ